MRFAMLLLCMTVLAFAGSAQGQGKNEKLIKADNTIKHDATTGRAKVGELVEFQVRYADEKPAPSGFKFTLDGKPFKNQAQITPVVEDNKLLLGYLNQSFFVRFDKAGKKKVMIEWTKGKEKGKKEIEVEVMGK